MRFPGSGRSGLVLSLLGVVAVFNGIGGALLGVCGPFTDVAADAFCPFVLEIFYTGITTGTTATTYDPAANVTRLQMAAFLSRSVDGVVKRVGARAAMSRFWTTQNGTVVGLTTVGNAPRFPQWDGEDVWVPSKNSDTVSRVHASDGRLLQTWTGADLAEGALVAMGRILVTGQTNPGSLYRIDPAEPAGAVTVVASTLGSLATGIAFDGARVWTTNFGPGGSVSIVTPGASIPWTVTTVTVGTGSTSPAGALYDGANIWITDFGLDALLKLDGSGAVLQTVTVGAGPILPTFDGANVWVPNGNGDSVSVVRASSGSLLATLTGNGLDGPVAAAFDGERVAIANQTGESLSLFKAANLAPLGSFSLGSGTAPIALCSDGVDFWIALGAAGKLARF